MATKPKLDNPATIVRLKDGNFAASEIRPRDVKVLEDGGAVVYPDVEIAKAAAKDLPVDHPVHKTFRIFGDRVALADQAPAIQPGDRPQAVSDLDVPGVDYSELSLSELRKAARQAGVRGTSRMKKAQLLSALNG